MKSFKDIKYRNYVLKQLRMKKTQIENIIRKKQDELKVLEATMENIVDGNFDSLCLLLMIRVYGLRGLKRSVLVVILLRYHVF